MNFIRIVVILSALFHFSQGLVQSFFFHFCSIFFIFVQNILFKRKFEQEKHHSFFAVIPLIIFFFFFSFCQPNNALRPHHVINVQRYQDVVGVVRLLNAKLVQSMDLQIQIPTVSVLGTLERIAAKTVIPLVIVENAKCGNPIVFGVQELETILHPANPLISSVAMLQLLVVSSFIYKYLVL